MKPNLFLSLCVVLLTAMLPLSAQLESEQLQQIYDELDLKTGPMTGKMRSVSEITVPEGYRFTGPSGSTRIMEMMGNLTDGSEIGFICPEDYFTDEDSWFIIFEFANIGYVKDDEKDVLDADKMFRELKKGQEAANKQLEQMGQSTMELTRWVVEPNYNESTNNLEWALELITQPEEELVVNHNIKILGRKGYVKATVVCSPGDLEEILPKARMLLAGFTFQSGQKYSEFREGDKIAQYGLTGLVVGGGLALAARSGLLGRLLKPILIGLIAVGAFIKKLFRGGRSE